MSKAQAKEVIGTFSKEYLLEQIRHIAKDFENKKIRNKGAYAYKAIINGYQYHKSLFDVEKGKVARTITLRNQELQKVQENFGKELSAKTKFIEQNLSDTQKEELLAEFAKYKINRVNRRSWKELGLDSPLIRPLCSFSTVVSPDRGISH